LHASIFLLSKQATLWATQHDSYVNTLWCFTSDLPTHASDTGGMGCLICPLGRAVMSRHCFRVMMDHS